MTTFLGSLKSPRLWWVWLCALISISASLNPHREVWLFCAPFTLSLLYYVRREEFRFTVFVAVLLCILAATLSSQRFAAIHPIARQHVHLSVELGVYQDGSSDVLPAGVTVLRQGMKARLSPGEYWASRVVASPGRIEGYAVVLESSAGPVRVEQGQGLLLHGQPVQASDLVNPVARWLLLPSQWPALLTGKIRL